MPTQKSATAKLAKKKLVTDRRRRENVTTRITNRLPGTGKGQKTKCFFNMFYLIKETSNGEEI